MCENSGGTDEYVCAVVGVMIGSPRGLWLMCTFGS